MALLFGRYRPRSVLVADTGTRLRLDQKTLSYAYILCPGHTVANHDGEPIRMWIRIRSPADLPLSYCSVLERVNSQKNLTVRNGSPCRYGCFKLFKTSVLPIRMRPSRCSSLQFVAVWIGSNQFFALRIALRIASQRNGLVRIGRVWRWAKNQKELTGTDSKQHETDTVVVACRAESLLFTAWRYDAVQFTSRTTKDCYGLQRCATM